MVALAFVGAVQWQLMLAGMAGFQGVAPAVWRVGAAAVVALVLWGAAGAERPRALDVGAAVLLARRRVRVHRRPAGWRYVVVAGGIAASFAVGFAASGNPYAGLSGVWWVFTYALFCVAQVWIWDVTLRLDKARTAEAEVAVLRERLRFAGDLHDIQGHQLQAIALKAQLAARLIGVDDELARRHAGDAHALALEALGETRELVQGYRRVGLAVELANAVGILRAAGVDAAVAGTPEAVPVALQPLFGSLVREGATNLLRHTRRRALRDRGRARGRRGRRADGRRRRGAVEGDRRRQRRRRACASASRPSAAASRPRRWPRAASSCPAARRTGPHDPPPAGHGWDRPDRERPAA